MENPFEALSEKELEIKAKQIAAEIQLERQELNRNQDMTHASIIFEHMRNIAKMKGLPIFEYKERNSLQSFYSFLMSFNKERRVTSDIEKIKTELLN